MPSIRNTVPTILVLLTSIASLSAEPVRLLLDRPGDPIGVNLGWEFPGVKAKLDVAKGPERGECRKFEYDFTHGGQYIQIDIGGPFAGVRNVRFQYKNTSPTKPIFRVKDDTDQQFIGTFDFKPGVWQEIVIPIEPGRFFAHLGGANDGKIHLPLRAISIGVEKTSALKGEFFLNRICADLVGTHAMPGFRAFFQPQPVGGVVFRDEKAECRVVLDNRLSISRKAKIACRVVNEDGHPCGQMKDEVVIDPFAIKTVSIPLSTAQYGYQQITGQILVPDLKPMDIESGLAVVRTPQRYRQKDPDSFFAGIQDKGLYEADAKLGVKNVMVSCNWQWSEVTPGAYSWDDETLNQLDKFGMGMMIKFNHFTPPWAQWTKAPKPELRSYIAPEHLASFEKWVRTAVERFKGRLTGVEIINEPDLGYWQGANIDLTTAIDLYDKTLQAGYRGAKSADPNLPVWGIGVSGFDQDTGFRFTQAALDKSSRYLDTVGNHTYAESRYIGKGKVAQTPQDARIDEKCRQTLDFLAKHNKPREMYIGELGWGLHVEEPALGEASLSFARMVAHALILAKSVPGVKAAYWFTTDACDESGYFYGLLRGWPNPMYPLPAACAYATCAHVLDHTNVVGPVKIGPGIRAWRFDRTDADQSAIAFWSEEGPITLTADLPAGSEIIDSLGRTIGKSPRAQLTLDILPVYAVGPKANTFAAAFENAKTHASKDLRIIQTHLVSDHELQAQVTNYTKSPIEAKLTLLKKTKTFTIPPGRQMLAMNVSRIAADPAAAPADIVVAWPNGEDRAKVRVDLQAVTKLTGPSSAAEKIRKLMAESRPILRSDRLSVLPPDPTIPWSGPEDLSLRVWTGWDENDLYLAVEVADDTHTITELGEGYWMSDSIQVALDPMNDSAANYDSNDTEFGFAGNDKATASQLGYPIAKPLTCTFLKVSRDATKRATLYTAAVPWRELGGVKPKPGQVIALNVIANDNDGQGRACWIGLTPGIGDEKRPAQYLRFVLGR